MDELGLQSFIRVRRKNIRFVHENVDKIRDLFAVRLCEKTLDEQGEHNVSKSGFVLLSVEFDQDYDENSSITDTAAQLQKYVDTLCSWERDGDDSSYDSDYEDSGVASHHDVSRTVSDTLGAEFAEYVSERPFIGTLGAEYLSERPLLGALGAEYLSDRPLLGALGAEYLSERPLLGALGAECYSERLAKENVSAQQPSAAGYTTRVEFGLKLGYTEQLVQAALRKLGPDPGQNELLEELVKLGAQAPPRMLESRLPDEDQPERCVDDSILLRPVVIDGSNVAMSHGNKEVFSCRGIKICVDWFRSRGHREITVFVPKWRKEASRPDNPITEQDLLTELERERALVFTPSRLVGGKRMVCYDDRYILRLAADVEGIVVSNDNYRDLVQEKPEFRRVVEERILMYSFVNDRFMPPDDPLGRSGPTLDNFLRLGSKRGGDAPPPCPYGKKCTYGNKCKFHHPERTTPHKSVTERLQENAQRQMQARGSCPAQKSLSLPLPAESEAPRKQPLTRTKSTAPTLVSEDNALRSCSSDSLVGCFRTPPPGYATNWVRTTEQPGGTWPASASFDQPPADSSANLHRKLQRQLTLNPSCDPRLHRYMQQHRPVQRHASDTTQAPWDRQHTNVSRIASAPPTHTSPPPMLWPPPSPHAPLMYTPTHEDIRRRLHYHLASIFPEEQVLKAMQIYPDETNPQKICAAILAMFPKS